jgi:hypothetical protein
MESSTPRISLGFHRLGLILAAVPLIIGLIITTMETDWAAPMPTSSAKWSRIPVDVVPRRFVPDPILQVDGLGKVMMGAVFEKLSPEEQQQAVNEIVSQNWHSKFLFPLAQGLGITLAASLAVYITARAVGWVIDGFAASGSQ